MDRLENPALLPHISPLQVYRERVAEFRESEAVLDDLVRCRRRLAALKKGDKNPPAPPSARRGEKYGRREEDAPLGFQNSVGSRRRRSNAKT
jgi:hypothetical protein